MPQSTSEASRHGTLTGYTTDRCRCDDCRGANNEYQKRWKRANATKAKATTANYRDAVVASRADDGRAARIKTHGLPGSYTSGCRCEECTRANREKQRAYYHTPNGKAVYQKMARAKRVERRVWLNAQKAFWCLDCGYVGPPEAMDFDHRPGETKLFGLADIVKSSAALSRLAKEILKCDLVCANCHRIRTAKRRRAKACA